MKSFTILTFLAILFAQAHGTQFQYGETLYEKQKRLLNLSEYLKNQTRISDIEVKWKRPSKEVGRKRESSRLSGYCNQNQIKIPEKANKRSPKFLTQKFLHKKAEEKALEYTELANQGAWIPHIQSTRYTNSSIASQYFRDLENSTEISLILHGFSFPFTLPNLKNLTIYTEDPDFLGHLEDLQGHKNLEFLTLLTPLPLDGKLGTILPPNLKSFSCLKINGDGLKALSKLPKLETLNVGEILEGAVNFEDFKALTDLDLGKTHPKRLKNLQNGLGLLQSLTITNIASLEKFLKGASLSQTLLHLGIDFQGQKSISKKIINLLEQKKLPNLCSLSCFNMNVKDENGESSTQRDSQETLEEKLKISVYFYSQSSADTLTQKAQEGKEVLDSKLLPVARKKLVS